MWRGDGATLAPGLSAFRSRPINDGRFDPAAVALTPYPLQPALDARTEMSDHSDVKGAEFERRLRKLARRKKVACEFMADKGKGSHGRLYFGEEFTTLKDRKKDIGRDLFAKMCRDLKIGPHEL